MIAFRPEQPLHLLLSAVIAAVLLPNPVLPPTAGLLLADEVPQALIVVIGAEGTSEFGIQFQTWGQRWCDAAKRGGCVVTLIGKSPDAALTDSEPTDEPVVDPGPEPEPGQEPGQEPGVDSDLTQLQQAISRYGSIATTEPLWIVLIGHGTSDGRQVSFGLRGPDITADSLAATCQAVVRPVALINCSSCSAPFLNALSGPDRVIVTATKDANQIQYSRFGDAMSQAISGLDADIDRDGQTSLLEAWLFASRRTAEFYTAEGRLATEHSLLDDNADQRGTRAELFEGIRPKADAQPAAAQQSAVVDGQLAARWCLVRSDAEKKLTTEQRQQRDDLESRLEELRLRRATLEESEFLDQLEEILVPLARIYEESDSKAPTAEEESPLPDEEPSGDEAESSNAVNSVS